MLDWDEVTKVRKLASAFNGAADGGGAVGNAVATDETLDSLDANDEPPAAAAAVAVVATDSSAAPSSSSATTTSAGIGSKFAAAKKRDRLGERKQKKKNRRRCDAAFNVSPNFSFAAHTFAMDTNAALRMELRRRNIGLLCKLILHESSRSDFTRLLLCFEIRSFFKGQ